MKAITIHQPWASLIAIGAKRFETRSWRTHYRGPIAIHAAKKIDHEAVLINARDYPHIWHKISPLPTGRIVAVGELTNCYEIERYKDRVELVLNHGDYGEYVDIDGMEMGGQEERFGWYADGRYAWELSNVRLIEPIPAKGRQGLWNWNPPEDWKCVICEEFVVGGGLCVDC